VEAKKHEMEETEKIMAKRQKEFDNLENKLAKFLPLIGEANLCAKEFGRQIFFSVNIFIDFLA
jgi:hypothetical protein